MEDIIPLSPQGIAILKQCRVAFCQVVQKKFGCTAQIHNVEDGPFSSFADSKASVASEVKYSKQIRNVKISVWKGDLTNHKVDAVVNPANEHLSHGGGLALALSKAGGPMIQRWSNDIIKDKGIISTGEVVGTDAGNLPCKMIIHAVGPYVHLMPTKTELENASGLLRKTIWSILQKVDYERLESVAIPAISSGLFNFPLPRCADIIVRTVKEFSEKRNHRALRLEVRLVNNDDPSVQQMERACQEILGPSETKPKQNRAGTPTQSSISSLNLGNVTLHLKKGTIEDESADVIVNTISNDYDLSKGHVSKALLNKAGFGIQAEIKRERYIFATGGEVIATSGHKLSCKEVYHTVCVPESISSDQILSTVVMKCLKLASNKSHSSISFPALGTGNLGLNKSEVSRIMTKAVEDFSKSYNGSKMQIFFVIFPKDSQTLKAFETEINSKRRAQTSSSTNRTSSGFPDTRDITTEPRIELFASSHTAKREAKRWCYDILHLSSSAPYKISNNHVMHLSQDEHEKLMALQLSYNVAITVFLKNGNGGVIIHGEGQDMCCAALEVEALLCNAQDDFAQNEEKVMLEDLDQLCLAGYFEPQQVDRMSNESYQKIELNKDDHELQRRIRVFSSCGLSIVKMEKIENYALNQLFEFNSRRIKAHPRPLYQRVNAQFCDLICRVGFHREYAPPKEQDYGDGIYFTTDVDDAFRLWEDNGEEYIYFIEAQVLTGKQILGSAGMIVPPLIGKDPLVRYDSVTSKKGIHVIFNGQQAYPELIITCTKQSKQNFNFKP